jgi:hypothetical protein
MRRSRKPVWAVPSIEGSNPSLSAEASRVSGRIVATRARSGRLAAPARPAIWPVRPMMRRAHRVIAARWSFAPAKLWAAGVPLSRFNDVWPSACSTFAISAGAWTRPRRWTARAVALPCTQCVVTVNFTGGVLWDVLWQVIPCIFCV